MNRNSIRDLQQMCGTARSGQHEFRNETLSDRKFKKSIVCKGITGINKKYARNAK